jgi:phage tail-like protein
VPRRDRDPYGSFRFTLELGSVQVAGFAECTGLQVETKVVDYVEGGRNDTTLKFPDVSTYNNVTLKRGLTASAELLDWQLDIARGSFRVNSRDLDRSVAIVLMDEGGEPVKRWNLVRALPVKWMGPDLKAGASEVAVEALELAHEGIVPG